MARKRIALDVDNTIADTFGYMHRYMLREHGIDYNKMGFRSMCSDELVEKTGLTEPQLRRIYTDAWTKGWHEIPPLAHPEKLQMLVSAHHVDIVSSRDDSTIEGLRMWCLSNYPSLSLELILPGFDSDKSLLPYDVYIDDSPDLAAKISLCSTKSMMLVNKPHNIEIGESANVIRAEDVNEAISLVLGRGRDFPGLRRG